METSSGRSMKSLEKRLTAQRLASKSTRSRIERTRRRPSPLLGDNAKVESFPSEDESKPSTSYPQVRDLGFRFLPLPPLLEWNSMKDAMDATELSLYFGLKPEAGTSVEKTLRKMVKQNSLPVKNEDTDNEDKFLPIDRFEWIFCAKSIRALVKEKYRQDTEEMQVAILKAINGRRRILATLLMMERLELMASFADKAILDESLPLRFPDSDHDDGQPNSPPLVSEHDRIKFRHYQYQFLAPYFAIERDPHCYIVNRHIRMPWLSFETLKKGNSRDVHKVQIHPGHHNFEVARTPGQPYFALKNVADETFEGELQALKKNSCKTHKTKHLVSLLLAIKQDHKRYLLFECADGDLSDFWKKCGDGAAPKRTATLNQKWAARQCLGLATALKLIHGRATLDIQKRKASPRPGYDEASNPLRDWGRHGDVKPQNILWFANRQDEEDLLVLSDLGSTRYHSRDTRSDVPNPGDGTPRYRAPEVNTIRRVSRKCDVWSLGCVFLEFCIWWLEGYDQLDLFEDARANKYETWDKYKEDNYFVLTATGQVAQVKPIVLEWIARLRRKHSTDTFAQNVLSLIQDHMIVVDLKERKRIDFICSDLQRIVDLLDKKPQFKQKDDSGNDRKHHQKAGTLRQVYQTMPALSTVRRNPPRGARGQRTLTDETLASRRIRRRG